MEFELTTLIHIEWKKSLKIPKGNQKPHIKGQIMQWPKEKVTKRQTMADNTLHTKFSNTNPTKNKKTGNTGFN